MNSSLLCLFDQTIYLLTYSFVAIITTIVLGIAAYSTNTVFLIKSALQVMHITTTTTLIL